jgi:hypothetical protein
MVGMQYLSRAIGARRQCSTRQGPGAADPTIPAAVLQGPWMGGHEKSLPRMKVTLPRQRSKS